MNTVLHVGCGRRSVPDMFVGWKEVRLDIDPEVEPDIVASITDLPADIGQFDAVYSSHCLEHLFPHDVIPALQGLKRASRGIVITVVPDLEGVTASAEVLYTSASGQKICGLDMIYGQYESLVGNPHMAHHCGFTRELLSRVMEAAGFPAALVFRAPFNLCAVAFVNPPPAEVAAKAAKMFGEGALRGNLA